MTEGDNGLKLSEQEEEGARGVEIMNSGVTPHWLNRLTKGSHVDISVESGPFTKPPCQEHGMLFGIGGGLPNTYIVAEPMKSDEMPYTILVGGAPGLDIGD